MVEMAVGEQHFIQAFETQTAFQNLPLCAFAAVEQEAVLAMQNDV
jgi:hypothetical protein